MYSKGWGKMALNNIQELEQYADVWLANNQWLVAGIFYQLMNPPISNMLCSAL